MIKVVLNRNQPIEQGIRQFTKKVKYTGVLKEVYKRKEFVKDSTKKRQEIMKAKYLQKLKNQLDS